METPQADDDGGWKEALDIYFHSLLELTFPHIAEDIRWECGVQPLDKELQEIVRDAELGKQRVDKLFQVTRWDGRPAHVLIHFEVQSQRDVKLPRRLYRYNHRTEDRFEKPTVSLVVLADNNPNWRPDHYEKALWGCRVLFEFPVCKLLDFDVEELKRKGTPGAIIVAAHLEAMRTKRDAEKRFNRRWEMTRRLYESGLEKKDILELYRLLDWLMTLPKEMTLQFRRRLIAYEEEKRMLYITSTERLSREEGREEGLQEGLQKGHLKGRQEALRDAILEVVTARFEGALPEEIRVKLEEIQDEGVLKNLFQAVLRARSVEEFLGRVHS